jgi:hypothetical protein
MFKFQLNQLTKELWRDISERKTPIKMLELILQILRGQFSDFEDYRWVDDEKKSEIIIDTSNIDEERLASGKPIIFVKRGTIALNSLVIKNKREINLRTAEETYQMGLSGTYAVFCMSSALLEAEQLGQFIFDILMVWAPIIETYLHFKVFKLTTIGEAGIAEDAKDKYLVPVILQYTHEEAWTLQRESIKLKGIDIETTSQ